MKVDREKLTSTISSMKGKGYDYLVKITAVDYVDHIDAIYILRDMEAKKDETLEVTLNPKDLWLPTIIDSHKSADWYEREMSEMFGIEIRGRRALRLLLEKWDGTDPPLRKTFQWYAPYNTANPKK
ncbi:MAG: NADH-quinone oxidoreductase subunit C [Candidatus Micrarchaeota archaeon]|nr:NADH-quinone oxidoreductase subunit C [Candidatus Micrarchaeota archaeon]MDE1833875.1 NADH-quinone oxidoreductase subunit C [Candidatus Micrarchaeota archaeon]MDE1859362.1 NADH-quinone oxidoreductase subunit C [Candidatus Micrarchaeota archaeon]